MGSAVASGVGGDSKIVNSAMIELVQSWLVTKNQGELGGGNFSLA